MGLDWACSPLACTESAEHSHSHGPKQGTPPCAHSHRGRQPSRLFGISGAAAAGAEATRRSTTHSDALPPPSEGEEGTQPQTPQGEPGRNWLMCVLHRTRSRSPSLP